MGESFEKMNALDEYLFSTKEKLDAALSDHICLLLEDALDKRGRATLVLSGGNTPKGMLERLSQKKISWAHVTVLLADERWVDPQSDRSNERMIREHFLNNEAGAANFESFHIPEIEAEAAPEILEGKLGFLDTNIEVTILGMGDDGHTASLFPCAENIEHLLSSQNQLKTVWVQPQNAPDQRISLSFPVLTASKNIIVHFTGDLKKEIFQKIISGNMTVPLGRVLEAADGKNSIFWAS